MPDFRTAPYIDYTCITVILTLLQKRIEFESQNACIINVWGCAKILPPNLIIVLLYIERKKKCRDSEHSLANLLVVLLLHRRQATQSAKPSASADNSLRDRDYSGHHKTESNNCFIIN